MSLAGSSVRRKNQRGGSVEEMSGTRRPVLIYDGDCGFCFYWVRYWQQLTGDKVEYRPYQDAASAHPDIPVADFRRAVQYIGQDGRRASAAEASFLTLSHAPGRSIWLALYQRLPGFRRVTEAAYAVIAAHRSAFYRICLILWGRDLEPPRYDLVSYLFLRLLGLIYLAAFVSFAHQAQGLIGSHGILPLADLVDGIASRYGPERFYLLPMVFWLNAGDLAIKAACWGGAGLSLLLVANILPRLSLALLYGLYLSLLYAGQTFMSYQWDIFLVETGFLALLLTFARLPGIWLLRWQLFRFVFMSGVVKLASGDPNWRNLSALSYHFLTQPLPTPLAWYVAHLPPRALEFATGSALFIELVLPFLIVLPRRPRFLAAFGILFLETLITLTGNYNWFNFQTMLLCLPLFDDAALRKVLPAGFVRMLRARAKPARPRRPVGIAVGVLALLIVACSLVQMDEQFGGDPPSLVLAINRAAGPFAIVNHYGLFAVMTTSRNEIVIQGSDDGVDWRDYEFRYKPGDVTRPALWNIPDQPRLDWQMWFAALDDPKRLPWFSLFLKRLLENEPTVTALLAKNPFPDKPPVYIRALFYDYTFANSEERVKGIYWDRRLLGLYFPAVRLKSD